MILLFSLQYLSESCLVNDNKFTQPLSYLVFHFYSLLSQTFTHSKLYLSNLIHKIQNIHVLHIWTNHFSFYSIADQLHLLTQKYFYKVFKDSMRNTLLKNGQNHGYRRIHGHGQIYNYSVFRKLVIVKFSAWETMSTLLILDQDMIWKLGKCFC
jgi:hypothetical protein